VSDRLMCEFVSVFYACFQLESIVPEDLYDSADNLRANKFPRPLIGYAQRMTESQGTTESKSNGKRGGYLDIICISWGEEGGGQDGQQGSTARVLKLKEE
jgi:hypothetical protein